MPIFLIDEVLVAETDAVFDFAFRETATIVEFADESQEQAYVETLDHLITALRNMARDILGEQVENQFFVLDDWWPNYTSYLSINLAAFTRPLFESILAILREKFPQWRIQIVAYDDMNDGSTQRGSATLWMSKLLIDAPLWTWMIDHGVLVDAPEPRQLRLPGYL